MNNIGKKSQFVLILLAGLVILLHSTIPHHHHLDSCSDYKNYTSCSVPGTGESSNEVDSHCHALNNVVYEKAHLNTFHTKIISSTVLFYVFDLVEFYNSTLLVTYAIKDIVLLKQYTGINLSLRGPPALV